MPATTYGLRRPSRRRAIAQPPDEHLVQGPEDPAARQDRAHRQAGDERRQVRIRGRSVVVEKPRTPALAERLGSDVVQAEQNTGAERRIQGKNQLFRRRILGPVVRSLGAFPAHDGPDGLGGIPAAATLARAGQAVAIFPEGARRRKRLHRPRTGAAVCALEAEVPLVPVALRGTDGWRRLARWGIAFGPPVPLDDLRAQDQRDAAREATDRLWGAVSSLELRLADRA
jgi:hypothetical protein